VVGQFPGLSAGELAHIVRLHPSTITGILQRLVAKGFLERTRDPGDSRRARLRLKPGAVVHTRTSPGTVEKVVTQVLNRIGASNVRAARRVLAEIAQELNDV
jgi:DNA-binding MarR family transcriptional regulator